MIDEATGTEVFEMVTLWQACGLTRPWNDPRADFAQALATPTATVLVQRDGGTIAGGVMVGFDGHRGWVYYLAVASERRGQGIGRALMAAAEAWLRERGARKLQLMLRDGNPASSFYEALGYSRQPVATYGRFL